MDVGKLLSSLAVNTETIPGWLRLQFWFIRYYGHQETCVTQTRSSATADIVRVVGHYAFKVIQGH